MRPADFEVRQGDALDVLRQLEAGSAQTCITSPPYFGLRDYGHDGQIGQEATVAEYVDRLVEVFEEVRRVLRDDGTLWLNLGDSYSSSPPGNVRGVSNRSGLHGAQTSKRYRERLTAGMGTKRSTIGAAPGLKPKDLIGVPWRVALALQDAGWWLRKDVIWDKPDPMPEAVRDRPTSAHEHVFLLTKAPRYYYDLDGFREPTTAERRSGNGYARDGRTGNHGQGFQRGDEDARYELADTRQLRDVWRIPLQAFPGAHFAVFPPDLPRRCILLGSSPRACEWCGAPWQRMVEHRRLLDGELVGGSWETGERGQGHRIGAQGVGHWRFTAERRTLGWRPSCTCRAPAGIKPGDLDEIDSPSGEPGEPDPTLLVGRAGMARPRGERAGVRTVTRFEQRAIAAQLARSPHRAEMAAEAGADAFAHYLRTDATGARPPRPALLEDWTARGWVRPVEAPDPWWHDAKPERCVVLDPFAGAGTTGLVAVDEGRDFVGVELSEAYAELSRQRIAERAAAPRFEFLS